MTDVSKMSNAQLLDLLENELYGKGEDHAKGGALTPVDNTYRVELGRRLNAGVTYMLGDHIMDRSNSTSNRWEVYTWPNYDNSEHSLSFTEAWAEIKRRHERDEAKGDCTELKQSELLRLAVRDTLAALEAGHTLDMKEWLRIAKDSTKCEVCMAGAVMLGRLDWEPHLCGDFVVPGEFPPKIEEALRIIDSLRVGEYYDVEGMSCLKEPEPHAHIQHWKDPAESAAFYREFADWLEERGL